MGAKMYSQMYLHEEPSLLSRVLPLARVGEEEQLQDLGCALVDDLLDGLSWALACLHSAGHYGIVCQFSSPESDSAAITQLTRHYLERMMAFEEASLTKFKIGQATAQDINDFV